MKITPAGKPFYFFKAAGSDYEIGLTKGREMAADIEAVWKLFEPMMDTWVSPDDHQRTYEWLRLNLEKVAPWMVEQADGMADGSGFPIEKVYFISHYGLLWSANGLLCSSVAVPETESGPILGQNLDIGGDDIYFVEELRPDKGHSTLSDGMAGMCWSPTGINDCGLAVGSSCLGVPSQQEVKPVPNGVPYHFLPRMVLRQCADVSEAVEYMKELTPTIPPGCGYQLNLIDKAGNMAVVDKAGDFTVVRQCEPGLNFTTNCSLDEELEKWRNGGKPTDLDHSNRAEHIRQYYKSNGEPSVEWMKNLLRSHDGDGYLCRHGTTRPGDGGYSRLSFVYYPISGKAEITNGWPCQNEYQEFKIE